MRNDVEQAERYSRQRADYLPMLAVLLIVQNGAFLAGSGGYGSAPALTGLVWMALALVLIVLAATGGWWFVGRRVRTLMNDEPALDARRTANSLGFLNGMVTAVFLYALTFLRDFNAREAIVIIFAVGMSSALLSFSMWERQALKDG